jgi:hypothetical protein
MNKNAWLAQYVGNVHSQSGEDGIIGKILSLLPERDRHCVEFGAWNGLHYSNTKRLIDEEDYSALLIEASESRFRELEKNYKDNPKVIAQNQMVGWEDSDCLDGILSRVNFPLDFDLLSVDIDGNDYHVWKAIKKYRPKLVVIEFNPTIPTEVEYVQRADPRVTRGCSLMSLCQLAKDKEYELVCVQPYNAFFVDKKYFKLFSIEDNRPETLRRDLSLITWMFIGYDGSIHLTGSRMMHWQQILLRPGEFNVLPRFLRKFPDDYNWLQRAAFKILKWFRERR